VGQGRLNTGLTGLEKTSRTWRDRQQQTRTQRQKEYRSHNQIAPRQDDAHCLGDEAVDEEEDEGVKHNSRLIGLSGGEPDIFALGSQKNTGA